MRAFLLAWLLLSPGLGSGPWGAQSDGAAGPDAVVRFDFARPAITASYRFELTESGAGTYRAQYPPTPPVTPGESVEVPLALHRGTVRKIFEQARSTAVLHGGCETKAKNVAQTGTKTLTLIEPGGATSTCTWNYSEKAAVVSLQSEFIGMASTLDAGRKLKMQQRFDRLGMDHEMGFLLDEAQAGRAPGLENIAPVLQAIADDTSLLERVRTRAKTLLQMSQVER